MITVVTMLWRDRDLARRGFAYRPANVQRMRDQVARHLSQPHRFVCITDEPQWLQEPFGIATVPLDMSVCVPGKVTARLQLFRRDAGDLLGASRVLYLSLETEIVGPLDPLAARTEPLVLMRNAAYGERRRFPPFSSAVMLLSAGHRPDVYEEFAAHKPMRTPWGTDACDWISLYAPADVATCDEDSGVWDERRVRRAWSSTGPRSSIPKGACLVSFQGGRRPWDADARAVHPWLAPTEAAA